MNKESARQIIKGVDGGSAQNKPTRDTGTEPGCVTVLTAIKDGIREAWNGPGVLEFAKVDGGWDVTCQALHTVVSIREPEDMPAADGQPSIIARWWYSATFPDGSGIGATHAATDCVKAAVTITSAIRNVPAYREACRAMRLHRDLMQLLRMFGEFTDSVHDTLGRDACARMLREAGMNREEARKFGFQSVCF